MPSFDDALKVDAQKVHGCTSQVWMHSTIDDDIFSFDGDSDAMWRTGTAGGKQSTDYGTGYALEKGKILDLRIHLNVVYRF